MQPIRPSDVKAWCLAHEFHPNRTLGQNFLIDSNILDAIVAAAALPSGAAVLEVGPGLGAVTQALLKAGARVTAVEKDHRLAAWIRESLGAESRMTLIEGDLLEVPLDDLLTDAASEQARFSACVSNLPYASGTRILLELCRHPRCPDTLVVTVQREVAERLAADGQAAARGQAGVWVQQNFDVTLLRTIKPACFWPRPEVASTLVSLARHHRHPLTSAERAAFDELTRHAFMHRRKQFAVTLRLAPPSLGLDPVRIETLLAQTEVAPTCRAETLTNEQWMSLARALAAHPGFRRGSDVRDAR
jgi:16S rRNA (adenine1518-N6/adenine1519-N6)-dimethyltransferase